MSEKDTRNLTPREIAAQHRDKELKKERSRRAFIGAAIIALVVAVVAVVTYVFRRNAQEASAASSGPAPAYGNAYGGVTLIKGNTLKKGGGFNVDASTVGDPASAEFTASNPPSGAKATPKGTPAQVIVYVDMLCPYCAAFEGSYGTGLKKLVEAGTITAEYRILNNLDRSTNNLYSSRSGGAMMSIADKYPTHFYDAMRALFEKQPSETVGADDDYIKEVLKGAGVPEGINAMIDNKEFRPYLDFATKLSHHEGVTGTPAALVEGVKWDAQKDGDFLEFVNKKIAARK